MTTCSLSDPVGVLATEHPHLIPRLELLGIDYCCHGSDTIAQACGRAGIDPARALAALRTHDTDPTPGNDPTTATMTELCDDIERTHHPLARTLFDRLGVLAPRVASTHGRAHPEFLELAEVLERLRAEMIDHMIREERVLFPWIRRLDTPNALHIGPPWSVRRPIDCMMHDHTRVAEALARIRALTRHFAAPADACTSVIVLLDALRDLDHDTRRHVHKENNILFPRALKAEAIRKDQRLDRSRSGKATPC